MKISKVGRRGQIAIPSAIRQDLNLQEGDRLAFVNRGDEVVLQPLKHTLLSRKSVDFFKKQALKHRVSYQRMIRSLLDEYAQRYINQ